MILKRLGILSVAKLLGCMYAAIGLLIGCLIALIGLLGAATGGHDAVLPGAGLGVLAVILCPLLYGALGFVGGAIMAALFNVFAGMVGGIELDLQPKPA